MLHIILIDFLNENFFKVETYNCQKVDAVIMTHNHKMTPSGQVNTIERVLVNYESIVMDCLKEF